MAFHIDTRGKWRQISQCHRYSETLSAAHDGSETLASSYNALTDYLVVTGDDDGQDFRISAADLKLKPQEYLLLCSDGVTDGVTLGECERIWQTYDKRTLVALKNKHKALGMHDDLSMVLVGGIE